MHSFTQILMTVAVMAEFIELFTTAVLFPATVATIYYAAYATFIIVFLAFLFQTGWLVYCSISSLVVITCEQGYVAFTQGVGFARLAEALNDQFGYNFDRWVVKELQALYLSIVVGVLCRQFLTFDRACYVAVVVMGVSSWILNRYDHGRLDSRNVVGVAVDEVLQGVETDETIAREDEVSAAPDASTKDEPSVDV